MKKSPISKIFILAVFLAGAFSAHASGIGVVLTESGDDPVTAGVDWGVPGYPDSRYLVVNLADLPSTTIVSTSTPWTIVSFGLYTQESSEEFYCDADNLDNASLISSESINGFSFTTSNTVFYKSNAQIHCNGSLTASDIDQGEVFIQYVPYDTRYHNENQMNDTHFAFIAGFFIFLSSFAMIVWIFKRKI